MPIFGFQIFTLNQYLRFVITTTKIQYFGSTNLNKGRIVEFGVQNIRLNIWGPQNIRLNI